MPSTNLELQYYKERYLPIITYGLATLNSLCPLILTGMLFLGWGTNLPDRELTIAHFHRFTNTVIGNSCVNKHNVNLDYTIVFIGDFSKQSN